MEKTGTLKMAPAGGPLHSEKKQNRTLKMAGPAGLLHRRQKTYNSLDTGCSGTRILQEILTILDVPVPETSSDTSIEHKEEL